MAKSASALGEFIRRQRRDSAAIPLKVWLAVLDQGLSSGTAYADLQSTLPRLKAPANGLVFAFSVT